MKELSYKERLMALKLPSLEYRRLRGDLIEMYKNVHKINDPLTTTTLFKLDSTNVCTRGHNFKLTKNTMPNNSYANFFSNRVTNHWNNLPSEAVNARTVCSFKINVDRFLTDLYYMTSEN